MATDTTQQLTEGTVQAVRDEGFAVCTEHGVCHAQVAFSCLIAPQVGDRVLCAAGEPGFILAILSRQTQDAVMSLPGDLTIRAQHGQMKLIAQEGIHAATVGDLTLTGARACVHVDEANAKARVFRVEGEEASAHLDRAHWVLGTVHAVIERVTEHLQSLFRRTEEREEVHAGEIALQSDSLLSMQSEYTVMVSEEVTKIDAEQIHMG